MSDSVNTLPPRQREVLNLIASLTDKNGYPPTLAELAQEMGLRNRMTVHQHVSALKKKGFVHWEQGLNRSLKVAEEYKSDTNIYPLKAKEGSKPKAGITESKVLEHKPKLPLVGRIAAGSPIDAIESDEYLEVESRYGDSNCFALKIKGDSMIEEGIFDGDFVIVKPQPSPGNGDIVVALLEDGTATLKRFYKENGRFRLQPANASMDPIYIDGSANLQIQGIVVGLFRQL